MRFVRFAWCVCLIAAFAVTAAFAQDTATVETPPSLAGVRWAGPAPNPSFLEGKTVVVLTYVTWCPKCNAWTGKVAAEIKQQSVDKPVVVLAISTDTPPAGALRYMEERGLVGPNVFHGYDPTIASRFGFANTFINYAIVSPNGKIVASGNAGRRYSDGEKPSYVPARTIAESKELGGLRFLKSEMSVPLKERLWLIELGIDRDVKKLESGLSPEDRDLLHSTIKSFLAKDLAELEELSTDESIAQRLSAVAKAKFLAEQFSATPEGRRAKELLTMLAKDSAIRDEGNAKRQYELAMKISDPARRTKAMEALSKKYPDTEFGKLASEAAPSTKP